MERQLLRRLLEHLHSLFLLLAQWRQFSTLNESRCGPQVVWVDLRDKAVCWFTLDEGDNSALEIRFLTVGVDFTLAVEPPVGRGESLCYIGTVGLQVVPEVVGRYDVRFAAFSCGAQTAQTDETARGVHVEVLACSRTVDADLVDVLASEVLAFDVLDVAQEVTLAVLRDSVAKVGTDHQVRSGGDFNGPALDWEALEHVEAWTMEDLVSKREQGSLKFQWEIHSGLRVRFVTTSQQQSHGQARLLDRLFNFSLTRSISA